MDENTTHRVYGTHNHGGKNPKGKLIFYKTGEKRRW
jgi:hypothetical protein